MTEQPAHPANVRRGVGIVADGTFHMPTRVQFGRGIFDTLADEVNTFQAKRVMIVSDPGVVSLGFVDRAVHQLQAAGIETLVFSQVQPNPRDIHCVAGADLARENNIDLIVGLGGGSPVDTAKCIAVLLTNGGHPRDWENFGTLQHPPIPVIAIPTTAGTGSEVSPSAIITDTVRKKKMNLFDPRICPAVALVDPDLTFSVPPKVTAATGMDALSHAIDSLHCRLDTPASDGMALEGARLVAMYLERAVADGNDVEARCGMMQASLVAGIAVGITDVSGCHSIAEAIGATYDTPHGITCAVGLPMIMDYNFEISKAKYVRLAHAFGLPTNGEDAAVAQSAITYVRELNERLEIPRLTELIDPADLDLLAAKALANTSTASNPRAADAADFRGIFEKELAISCGQFVRG
ncbi:MAG: iron-containing alcohol dehydrogenase [Actinomycetes bacterium]